jgi:mono/diheme cytochrome c family protein
MSRSWASIALASVVVSFTSIPLAESAQKARGREIEVWARKPGDHAGKPDGARLAIGVLNLDDLTPEQARLADVQLGQTFDYEGVALDVVLEKFKKKLGKSNRILLHFVNGMVIPIQMPGDGERTGIFIARSVRVGADYSTAFPDVPKKEGLVPEPQPVSFVGNKVVVEDGAHPLQPSSAVATFTPWHYVDSLEGIELVDGKAYDRQFEVDKASDEVVRGMGTFLGRCQYCHGVREIGATYGWDFVVPNPIFTYKDAASLLTHVKLPASRDAKSGKTMPGQKDAEGPEMQELWSWTKAIAEAKLKVYKP